MNTKTTVISQAELDAQFACCDKIAAYWQTKGRTPPPTWRPTAASRTRPIPKRSAGFLAQCGYAIIAGSAEGARMWSS